MLGLHAAGAPVCFGQYQQRVQRLSTAGRVAARSVHRISASCRLQTLPQQRHRHVCLALEPDNGSIDEDVTDSYDEADADDVASGWDAALGHIEDEPSEASSSQQQAAPSNLPADYYEEDATGSITGLPPRIMAKSATVVREIVGKELQDFLDREAAANYVEPVFTGRELTEVQQAEMVARSEDYHAFQMEKLQLLVREHPDGRLVLSESLIIDSEGRYLVPDLQEGVSSQAALYQVVPWFSTFFGDSLKMKEAERHAVKLYFLPVLDVPGERGVDLEEVYCFDGNTSVLSRAPVKRIEPIIDPVLRITRDGLIMEDSGLAMDPVHVAMLGAAGLSQEDRETYEEVLQELDTDLIDDLEEIPDVSAADLM